MHSKTSLRGDEAERICPTQAYLSSQVKINGSLQVMMSFLTFRTRAEPSLVNEMINSTSAALPQREHSELEHAPCAITPSY